jgi:prepilin-type N-terminal cleavage/methylation domain-containing protein
MTVFGVASAEKLSCHGVKHAGPIAIRGGGKLGGQQPNSNPDRGITLIEVLVSLALISVAGTLFTGAFLNGVRIRNWSQASAERLRNLGDVGGAFRADVASASSLMDELGSYKSGSDTVILDFAPGTSPIPAAAHVIWHWQPNAANDGGRLVRIRWQSDSDNQAAPVSRDGLFNRASFEVTKQGDGAEQSRQGCEHHATSITARSCGQPVRW